MGEREGEDEEEVKVDGKEEREEKWARSSHVTDHANNPSPFIHRKCRTPCYIATTPRSGCAVVYFFHAERVIVSSPSLGDLTLRLLRNSP